jgi:hypothetical protein
VDLSVWGSGNVGDGGVVRLRGLSAGMAVVWSWCFYEEG